MEVKKTTGMLGRLDTRKDKDGREGRNKDEWGYMETLTVHRLTAGNESSA